MHKVSQDEAQMLALFKAMAPGCWDAGYKSHGELGSAILTALAQTSIITGCKTNAEGKFSLFAFFPKGKNTLQIHSLSINPY